MRGRERMTFDWDWRFHLGDAAGAEKPEFDDRSWRSLHLPHDWSVEGDFAETFPTGGDGGYVQAGIGWYRKSFNVSPDWSGKHITLQFDGVYMNSEVWINGHFLGRYPFGYGGFHYDLTPYLDFEGKNVVAVKVDNSDQPNSRWYTGSGIYRHTWLQAADLTHIDRWGVFVTTPEITDDYAVIRIQTKLNNGYGHDRQVTLRSEVVSPDGTLAAVCETPVTAGANRISEVAQTFQVSFPVLWSVEEPRLYLLRSTVLSEGTPIDTEETPFGIRTALFDKDRGFLLNGRQVKMNGVCIHHDGGCVGAAVPERVWERRLEILKEMGCNAIRMSHNPPAPELLDLCDRMGFLVMDEAFDEWRIAKTKNGIEKAPGYSKYFDEWAERDLTMMIRRDRNHPSVVIWSIGNEIPEQSVPDGYVLARRLVEICHREDPTRPVTAACDHIASEPVPAYEAFLESLDVVGYNYVARWRMRTETFYADDRHRYPERKIIGTENPGIGAVRGDYRMQGSWDQWRGPYPTRMINAERLWKFTRSHDYVAGDFMWTGIDYLGESRWPNKNASSGVIDTCGFPKDGYYFYQSQWTEKPMAHLFPHWNWQGKEGTVIPVLCYTNCDMAELFVNGKSFGIKSYEFPRQGMSKRWAHFDKKVLHVTTSDLHLSWDVPYEPGVLRLVGYSRDGEVLVEKEVVTAGEPAAIEAIPDRETIRADGRDVSHITIRVVDKEGRVVPTANIPFLIRVEGEGSLIGVDNGRPDCHESYKSNKRTTFHGLALAIVQSARQPGEMTVTVEAGGLDSLVRTIRTV